MIRPILLVATLLAARPPAGAAEPLTKAEIVRLAKPATAYVDAGERKGSGFCVHESGLFVTNAHVVADIKDDGRVKLVLNPGEAGQKVLQAAIARRDAALDLALLRAESPGKCPALGLGDDGKLSELDEVVTLGFPFGSLLGLYPPPGAASYPTVSVNAGNVSSFRRDAKGALKRIQLDGSLNPGNSGGPVLARDGRVVGVVVSGIAGAGINLAIPAGDVRRFLDKPEVALRAPAVEPKDKARPAAFRALIARVPPAEGPFEAELVLDSGGGERRFPMALDPATGDYVAEAAPYPPGPAAGPRVEIRFANGVLAGQVEDVTFRVGGQPHALSEVQSVRFGAAASVGLAGKRTWLGKLSGLDSVTLDLGGQRVPVSLAGAAELTVVPDPGRGSYTATVVAKLGGREVGRQTTKLYLVGAERGGVEAILKGRFVKPPPAAEPNTHAKLVSTAGDYIGAGRTYNYAPAEVTATALGGGVRVRMRKKGGEFELSVYPPRGAVLDVGEYPGAKRAPFRDAAPGLELTGEHRGCNTLTGKFVVWELETEGGVVTKCAIDFVQYCEGGPAPLVGVVRYNSSFE